MILLARFWRDERGSSAIEYGLLAGMISCVIIWGLQKIGTRVGNKFQAVSTGLS